jgi:hypothetical protein
MRSRSRALALYKISGRDMLKMVDKQQFHVGENMKKLVISMAACVALAPSLMAAPLEQNAS